MPDFASLRGIKPRLILSRSLIPGIDWKFPWPKTMQFPTTFEPLSPLRPSDLIHTRNAIQEHTEKLIALSKLDLREVEFAAWGGFILRLSPCPRLEEWWGCRPNRKKHVWIDSAELDDFRTTLLLAHSNAKNSDGIYAAICSWRDVQEAAADLRIRYLGPDLLAMHGPNIFTSTAQEIIQRFQLEERPLNSTAIPCCCRLKWGYLQRFPQPSIPAVLDYYNIAQPEDVSLPILVKLGANLAIVLAFSPSADESLRIGLCCQWHAGLAIDDLGAWLRTFPSSNHLGQLRELQWIAPGCFSSLSHGAAPEEAIA